MLPSPIPHPLDYCPWDVPGWIYEALDWVVGVEWPEGDERAVWDLADQWYGVAGVLAGPRDDATTAAGEVKSGYGGVGLVAHAFDTAWHRVAGGEDAPLHVLVSATDELGRLVDSCGCDIEGAKLEAWIELGILVVELLSLAVVTVLTAGAASPAAGAAITATRMAVQQIFRRLVADLARKAVREGLKEAGERAAKEVAKSGAKGLARRAVLGGLVEAGQEASTSLATQAYQNTTGRRDGLDLADVGTSGLGGFAGGAAAPLASLGRHASGRFAEIGERFGREMAGESLAETAAGLATGHGPSLEDLARAAASGATGSATGQADTALHHRLDAKLGGFTAPPVGFDVPPPPDPVGLVPSQRTPEPSPSGWGGDQAVSHPRTNPEAVTPAPPPAMADAPLSRALTGADTEPVVSAEPAGAAPDVTARPPSHPADHPSPSVLTSDSAHPAVATSPTLSSVAVEVPAAGTSVTAPTEPRTGSPPATVDVSRPSPAAPVHAAAAPTLSPPPAVDAAHPAAPSTLDRPALGVGGGQPGSLPTPPVHPQVGPHPATPGAGPDPRPAPNPRFPLLETLAPAHSANPPPAVFNPLDSPPPNVETLRERVARLVADREALDRRRYGGYLRSQREWFEDRRRQTRADWLRERADYHEERASDWAAQATALRRDGRTLAAEQWHREAHEAALEASELRDEARNVLAGRVVPERVMVEDDLDFYRINDDVADLALGAVETPDHSALTGNRHPPSVDQSRPYGIRGGLRPPLALHQTDLERQMPRNPDGSVVRTADPRRGGWFRLANDGGPSADATRGINCLDCTLSFYDTWVHGRPRVAAPRTFDGYLAGDVRRPVGGEVDGPLRVEETTGGRFQNLTAPGRPGVTGAARRTLVEGGYRDLHAQLAAGGHGSYAFLITSFEGGGSHAWVALNQNGTVLYLDPQTGAVADQPLYRHGGTSFAGNVVGVDALVLGPDGRPMPLAGRPPGTFNVLPEPSPRPAPPRPPDPPPSDGGNPPDFNRVHLLGESTTFHRPSDTSPPGSAPPIEPDPADIRRAHREAHAARFAAGIYVRDALATSGSLDDAFAVGVTPLELAQHADGPTLRRLVPGLEESAAADLKRLFADPRAQRMLDQSWEAPPRREELLAETLVGQLAERPDLVRMMLATPTLANSLTARPVTLHHLASHQKAIDVLDDVLHEIRERGAEAVSAAPTPPVEPTPLTPAQISVSERFEAERPVALQPGFDRARSVDSHYQKQYLDQLYRAASIAQGELDSLGRELAERSANGAEYKPRPGPKDRVRAEDKIARNGGNAARLRDLAAGRVSYRTLNDLYAGLASLSTDPRVQIADFDDRFRKPQDSGYRDIQFSLRTSTGHIAEFRLHLAAMDDVAEWEHSLFEVWRDLEAVSGSERRTLSVEEAAIRKGIVRRQREHFWAALQSTLSGGQR
ncbi:toxin glutamine deamidase domain-containing protein [Micromonospora sp. WMMA1998]|uniref:toxin glutamine deamidase domain-containing protein n=1 Tax=Micromonospora sp. WMMA1998 TaxID=3015167 RepID=UPI00248BE0EF|nr:toxin glutamine deamidase domain-containing protein [Micromonospora sp. WMMA1998]WBC18189.1 toxin glutamine deamidase domain-containing protein [Micromonospora sp. WMMA1998]